MRLDFNVLWVEDQPDGVASQIRAVKRNMAEEGFELKPTVCTDVNQVQARLADDLFKDEVDLILVDWDLGKGVQGQTVITGIRQEIYYKDIIFYSAVTDIMYLKKASFEEGHEGIYFVRRDGLVNEVTSVFRSMIKKVLDLDHTRGIVMGATSDVDQTARECLQLAHDMLDEAGRAGMLSDVVKLLDDKVPNLTKRVEKLKKSPDIHAIIASHLTFTANDGLRILVHLLESGKIGDNKQVYIEDIKAYIKDVVPTRNILGHQVLSPEGRPIGIADTSEKTISLDELRALRKTLLNVRQRFRELRVVLSGPD